MEPLESERRPGTVANQALEAGSVMALDTDARVEAKPTTVIPAEHILGFVGFEEAMATKMAKDSFAYRMLEALQELGGEIGSFVEVEAWSRGFVVPVSIDSLEESIDDGQVKVEMGIETGACPAVCPPRSNKSGTLTLRRAYRQKAGMGSLPARPYVRSGLNPNIPKQRELKWGIPAGATVRPSGTSYLKKRLWSAFIRSARIRRTE